MRKMLHRRNRHSCHLRCYCNTNDDSQTVTSIGKDNDSLFTIPTCLSSNNCLNDLTNNNYHRFQDTSKKSTIIANLPKKFTTTIVTSNNFRGTRRPNAIHDRLEHRIAEGLRWRQRLGPRVRTKNIPLISSKYYSQIDRKNNNLVCFTFTKTLFICFNFTKILLILLAIVTPILSSTSSFQNEFTMHDNRNSVQFQISQLCSPRSSIPVSRRVEGATLTATPADTDTNCTMSFRTKSSLQHFVIRFEELKLGCDDHLVLFDGDLYYASIKDFSCRDNMASVPIIKTTGNSLTIRYSSDGISKLGDGFRIVFTAVFDKTISDCPPEYAFCRSQLCISRSLFCDGINHCLDNSDEVGCNGPDDSIELPYALGFFVILVLAISVGVIVCILLHCRRDNPYAQYQHNLQRAFGVPLQPSSSVMFANQQPQYQFFQPANMSPYVTPQHHALIATLPRGYSTLPLNLLRQQHQHPQQFHQQHPQTILAKPNNIGNDMNTEYLMMTSLGGHAQNTSAAAIQSPQATPLQTNLTSLPNSQSILSTTTGGRYTHAGQRDRGCNGGPGSGGAG